MSSRNRLDNRRPSETFDITFGGHSYTVSAGFYPDGRVGEVFIAGRKPEAKRMTRPVMLR